MNENRMRILNMVAQAKITPQEAEQLLQSLAEVQSPDDSAPRAPAGGSPKYLRVVVEGSEEHGGDRVNVRVPMNLIRAGVRLAALLPPGVYGKVNQELKKQGIDMDLRQIKPEHLEDLVESLAELTVDVQGQGDKVRVFCE